MMLCIGAALMIVIFTHLTRIELGFRPDHVLTLRISLPGQRYPSADKVSAFCRDLLGRVSVLPRARGVSSLVPLDGGGAESSILPQDDAVSRPRLHLRFRQRRLFPARWESHPPAGAHFHKCDRAGLAGRSW